MGKVKGGEAHEKRGEGIKIKIFDGLGEEVFALGGVEIQVSYLGAERSELFQKDVENRGVRNLKVKGPEVRRLEGENRAIYGVKICMVKFVTICQKLRVNLKLLNAIDVVEAQAARFEEERVGALQSGRRIGVLIECESKKKTAKKIRGKKRQGFVVPCSANHGASKEIKRELRS